MAQRKKPRPHYVSTDEVTVVVFLLGPFMGLFVTKESRHAFTINQRNMEQIYVTCYIFVSPPAPALKPPRALLALGQREVKLTMVPGSSLCPSILLFQQVSLRDFQNNNGGRLGYI